jgi:hypothetical protein
MDLYRLAVAMHRNWRRPDGTLRSVPAMPRTSNQLLKLRGVAA